MTANARPPSASTALVGASLLVPGRNCWRVETSPSVRLIQDAAEYFRLARQAILAAERSVFLLGWDIHAGLDLVPEGVEDDAPTRLAELLDFVARRRPALRCHVLVWDHSTLYSLERDPFTRIRLSWLTHRRVLFRFDDQHPLAASKHDKVLVVDDDLAFAGSIDLTSHRWDTCAHEVEQPHRLSATGQPYGPYHDVQLMVAGAAAAALGELARDRWRRLGRKRLPPIAEPRPGRWLPGVPVDAHEVRVGISRTQPAFRSQPGTHECEQLFHDAIAAARRWIYIENQYFTDPGVARALAARLGERDGPEVVAVLPLACHGWLERNTIGALRQQVLAELRAADRHDRLRLLHPMASCRAGVSTFVHSKVLVIDDRLLRVGSANLARRSMGVDSECDVAIDADGDVQGRQSVLQMLARLVAEHLGVDADDVVAGLRRTDSLLQTIAALCGGDRALLDLDVTTVPPPVSETMRALVDPHEPMEVVADVDNALPDLEASENRGRRVSRLVPVLVVTVAVIAFGLAIRHDAGPFDDLDALLTAAPTSAMAWCAAALVCAVAGLTFVPLYWVALGAGWLLGIAAGSAAAYVGVLIGAAGGYTLGRALSPARLASWIGSRVYRLLRTMHGRDVRSVTMLRLAPVASVTTVHLLCGAAGVPARAYWLGTALGLLPTVVGAASIGGLARRTEVYGEVGSGVAALLLACLFVAAALRLRWLLLMQRASRALEAQSARSRFG